MKCIIPYSILAIFILASCKKDNNLKDLIELKPTKVQLIFPQNISECIEGSILSETHSEVTFRWEPSENTDNYELHITNLLLYSTETYSTTNTELGITIPRGTPYSWYVSSHNNSAKVTSDTWSFYNSGSKTEYFIPFPAQNSYPEMRDSLPFNQSSVTLEWVGHDLDSDILDYDVYFDTSSPPTLYLEKTNKNNLADIPIAPGTTYYWKITTRDSLGNESNSNIFVFEVKQN